MDLVKVIVPANADGSSTKMITVDSKMAENFYKFVWAMNQKYGLIVTSDFRSKTKQASHRDFINNNLNNPLMIVSYWLSVNPNIKIY